MELRKIWLRWGIPSIKPLVRLNCQYQHEPNYAHYDLVLPI
jgi:hypothetical protein